MVGNLGQNLTTNIHLKQSNKTIINQITQVQKKLEYNYYKTHIFNYLIVIIQKHCILLSSFFPLSLNNVMRAICMLDCQQDSLIKLPSANLKLIIIIFFVYLYFSLALKKLEEDAVQIMNTLMYVKRWHMQLQSNDIFRNEKPI